MENPSVPAFFGSLHRIHAVITRGLAVTIEQSQVFASSGFATESLRTGFYRYAKSLTALLEGHHKGEELVAFPFFLKRLPDLRLEGLKFQHEQMRPHMANLASAVERVLSGETQPALKAIQEYGEKLSLLWEMHRQAEENYFASDSVTVRFISAEDQQEVTRLAAEFNQKNVNPAEWVVPFILFNLPAAERDEMAKAMPAMVTKMLVPVAWKKEWAPMQPFFLA